MTAPLRAEPIRAPRAPQPALALAPAAAEPPPAAPPRIASIRWIVSGAMTALVVAVVAVVGAVTERHARRALAAEMTANLQLTARNVALVGADALLTATPEWALIPMARQTLERQPALAFVTVVDRNGLIQGDADVRRIGTPFQPPPGLAPQSGPPAPPGESLAAGGDLVVAMVPVLDGDGRTLGASWAGLRRSAIDRRLDAARRTMLAVVLVVLALSAAAAWLLSSALLRPVAALRRGLERIGSGDLAARLEVRDRTEIGALAGAVNRMAAELERAQRDLVQRERLAHEVHLAERIQKSLLPAHPRNAAAFVIAGAQQAAAEVGGDYYQTLDLPDGRIGLVMADVSGKGLGGALVTAMLHALLRALAPRHAAPAALLEALDAQIGAMLERGSFVTLFYGVLTPASGELVFSSAGHNPLLLLRAGQAEPLWVRGRGAPLGALRSPRLRPSYEEVRLTLAPGDLAIQYTDGITEAFGPDGESQFGPERFAAAALAARGAGARAVLDAVTAAVAGWRAGGARSDDETLLVLSRERGGASAALGNLSNLAADAEALEALAQAERRGARLVLPARLSELTQLDEWLDRETPAPRLGGRAGNLLRLALHEACANVVEHALGSVPGGGRAEVWWVPGLADGAPGTDPATLEGGYFLIRDRGVPFRYQSWRPPNLESREVRRRGRGLGLDILHRVARTIRYWPSTPEGNLVCLTFDPGTLGTVPR